MLKRDMAEKGTARMYCPLNASAPAAIDELATILGRQLSVYLVKCQAAAATHLGTPLGEVKALDLVMAFDALATGHLAQLLGISAGGGGPRRSSTGSSRPDW